MCCCFSSRHPPSEDFESFLNGRFPDLWHKSFAFSVSQWHNEGPSTNYSSGGCSGFKPLSLLTRSVLGHHKGVFSCLKQNIIMIRKKQSSIALLINS